MKNFGMICILALLIMLPTNGLAGNVADFLIMQDIGPYKFIGKGGGGQGAGILAPTDHFNKDHPDKSFGSVYFYDANEIGVNVEVTQHAGADSDQWLAHEIDESFRDDFGIPNKSYGPRQINGQTVYVISIGGRGYRWLSGNKVIEIAYHGSLTTLPEPIEVVQAYLTKHPSTRPAMTLVQLRSATNKTTWTKDEMSRRLWLCDKWVLQIQTSDPKLYDKLKSIVDCMTVFVNYREKYYGMASASDKNLLSGYLGQKNDAGIRAKLAEYKAWWTMHKADAISLP